MSAAHKSFLHAEQNDFGDLILLVARERGLPEFTVEKDYWVALREEHLKLKDWYWAEYPGLDEACLRIRDFILEADLHALASE